MPKKVPQNPSRARKGPNRKAGAPTKKRAKRAKKQASVEVVDLEATQQWRLNFVGYALSGVLLFVVGFSGYLQGCESEPMRELAKKNYLRMLRIDTQRGDILDRNGEALATSVEADSVYADPSAVEDKVHTAQELSQILGLEIEHVMHRLGVKTRHSFLKRQVTADEAEAVRALGLKGIQISKEARRFYPKKELAGQVLGVVGYDSAGLEGLERRWDEQLRGGKLTAPYHRDRRGNYSLLEALPAYETAAGHSLKLTIDEKIQEVAERELARACLSSLALSGVAVVMDVHTGDVLAMANFPRFNPNRYREQLSEDRALSEAGHRTVSRFKNRVVTDQFEPGSTFKVFTLAAAIEEGIVGLDDMMDLERGRYKVGRKWISDTHQFKKPQSIRDVLKHSSNVGFVKMGQMLGRDRLHGWLEAFGFGSRTGIDVPGEASGALHPPNKWADITLANVAFGQGVAVSALQLTAGLAALGNGGTLRRPRLVMAEYGSDGHVLRDFPVDAGRRVVSQSTARSVVEAMKSVVEFDGTGSAGWIYDYQVAGKTGTAQKVDPIAGGYAEDRWVASFFGLIPADRPRLAILVSVDEPQGPYYGGVVAAPAFKEIAQWSMEYLAVPPSYGGREKIAREPLVKHYGRPHTAGEGAYYDWPADRQPGVDPDEPRIVTVPEFSGLTLRRAVRTAHAQGLLVSVDGNGIVKGQSLPRGRRVPPWTRVMLHLERPTPTPPGGSR